ncbi:hypothetical protein [Singulisphaera sp. PoT]|uniref:hypothetical protein n=1 Tax=Singulisphaera sp. PoT TaxID=3411797 RepID=UPI003BF4D6BF
MSDPITRLGLSRPRVPRLTPAQLESLRAEAREARARVEAAALAAARKIACPPRPDPGLMKIDPALLMRPILGQGSR